MVLALLCLCGCQAQMPVSNTLPECQEAIDRLCETRLKRLYVWCSCEALRRRLDYVEATGCSLVYETLLRRGFGGDFDALLA
jgi:hypothetical protein